MMNRVEQRNERRWIGWVLGLVLMGALAVSAGAVAESDHDGHGHAASFTSGQAGCAAHDGHEAGNEHADEVHGDEGCDDHDAHDHDAEDHDEEGHDEEGHDEEEAEHAEDEHGGHEGHEEEGLHLTAEQRERFGIVVRVAASGSLRNEVKLPGEIVFNEDRVVHMVPRVAGIAREVHKTMGDRVRAGDVLAVIDSRELADAKLAFLVAEARAALAEKSFVREKALREKEVSSEQDFLEAEQAFAEAGIELRSTEQNLHALGLSEDTVKALGNAHDAGITRYEIRAPIDGVVTERHIALGESLAADSDIFTVVDIGSVWVNLAVYTKNLAAVRPGQDVALRVDHSGVRGRGTVTMVTPFVEKSTRSATARVVLDNRDGHWIPGTFVTGFISVSEENLPVVVPRAAVQSIEGRDVVFSEHEGGFEMVSVTLGRTDRTNVEVLAGLKPGMRYVAEGAFQLKATVVTSNLGSHAGHGH